MAAAVSLSTSGRREELWERSQRSVCRNRDVYMWLTFLLLSTV